MYVARRNGRCYLARMPGSGFLHAAGCPAYEKASHLSGLSAYPDGLVTEQDGGTFTIASVSSDRAALSEPASVKHDGLLDILISRACLNQWRPDSARPNWVSVSDALHAAAEGILVGGAPLSSSLYVPRKYDRETSDNAHQEAADFIRKADGGSYLCAPLKEIQKTPYGYRIVLTHLPYLRLWLSTEHANEIEARYGVAVFSSPPRFALCLVSAHEGRKNGNFNVDNIAIRSTDALYLPCDSEFMAMQADELRKRGEEFVRPLRFDAPKSHPLADFVVLSGDKFDPVICSGETGDPEIDVARRGLAALLSRHGA